MDENNNTFMNDTPNESLPEGIIINEANEGSDNDAAIPGESASEIFEVDEAERLKKEVEQYKDKYIRLVADFENYKRRNAKERMELMQTAGKEIITSLLDVLDDCDRAEKQMNTSADVEQVKEGVQLVFNKLKNILQAKGLKVMESLNSNFDVEKHEAITEIEVPEKSRKGKVIDEVVKGYYLNDKLIRFAKVVVAK
ncbi:MAG: nucleotide exchange factor GrpE [Ginsengibacter sp.]